MTRKLLIVVALLLAVTIHVGDVSAAVSFPQIAKLTTLDAAPGDSLGYSVSIKR